MTRYAAELSVLQHMHAEDADMLKTNHDITACILAPGRQACRSAVLCRNRRTCAACVWWRIAPACPAGAKWPRVALGRGVMGLTR
jgi:hypothetical protein